MGVDISAWKRQRFSTFFIFCIQYLLNGMVYNLLLSTYWTYITKQLKTSKPYLVYALMNNLQYIPTILFSLLIGNLHDIFRKTKLVMIILNFICIIGGVLYAFSISSVLALTACFLLGFRHLPLPITVGEVARSYAPEQLTYKLPLMNFFFCLGSGPAAIITYISNDISFNFLSLQIDYGNFPGFLIVIMYMTLNILVMCFVYDISLHYDYKANIQGEQSKSLLNEETKESGNRNHRENEASFLTKLKRVLSNFDVALTYFLVFLFNFLAYLTFQYIPLLIQTELEYDVQVVNLFFLGHFITLVFFIPVLIYVKVNSKTAYYVGLISFGLMIISGIALKIMNPNRGKIYNISLLILILLVYAIIYTSEDIFLTCTISKFAKADIQSFADGMRVMALMIGGSLGCLAVAPFIEYKNVFYELSLLVLLVTIILLIYRRKSLQNPQPTI